MAISAASLALVAIALIAIDFVCSYNTTATLFAKTTKIGPFHQSKTFKAKTFNSDLLVLLPTRKPSPTVVPIQHTSAPPDGSPSVEDSLEGEDGQSGGSTGSTPSQSLSSTSPTQTKTPSLQPPLSSTPSASLSPTAETHALTDAPTIPRYSVQAPGDVSPSFPAASPTTTGSASPIGSETSDQSNKPTSLTEHSDTLTKDITSRLTEPEIQPEVTTDRCIIGNETGVSITSIELPYYYRLETVAYDDSVLAIIENALIQLACNDAASSRRSLSTVLGSEMVAYNSSPTDVLSNEVTCSATSIQAQDCHIVEGGMTLTTDDTVNVDHNIIARLFDKLSLDDPNVVEVKYLGSDKTSLVPGDGFSNTNESDVESQPLFPIVFIAASFALLIVATMIGFIILKDKEQLPIRDDEKISDNNSSTHETADLTMVMTASPVGADTTLPSAPSSSTANPEHFAKSFVFAEEEQENWQKLGIAPSVTSTGACLEGIREEVSSGSEYFDEKSV